MKESDIVYITTAYGPNNKIYYSTVHAATSSIEQADINGEEFRVYLESIGLVKGKDFY